MYVAIVYKDSSLRQIHKVYGPFKSFDSAAEWALDKHPVPFAVIVKWLEAPL